MIKTQSFSGVITAIISPFQRSGDLDINAFHKIIDAQKKSGVNGIVVLGSTGEAATLTSQESDYLVSAALEHKTSDFQILVGTGTNCTATTIEKSKKYSEFKAHGQNVDGLLIVTPYYNKPLQEHLIYHFHEVCSEVSETPVCVYNVPGRTGVNLHAETFVKIASQNKNVVAIKEAAGCINAVTQMRLFLDAKDLSHIRILSGDDATFAPALLGGADGVISVTSHIIPKSMCEILENAKNGLWNAVKDLHLKTYLLQHGISCVTNPVGIKFLLSKVGFCENLLRAPLYAANTEESHKLERLLIDLKSKHIQLIGE